MPWEQGLPSSGSSGYVSTAPAVPRGVTLLLRPSLCIYTRGCWHRHLMGLLMKQEASQLSLGIRNVPFSSLSRPTTVGVLSLFWRLTHRCTGSFYLRHVESAEVLKREGSTRGRHPIPVQPLMGAHCHPGLSPQHASTLSLLRR